MTPHEKAVNAINTRLEQLQAELREAKGEAAAQFVVQSLVVTLGLAEALTDYIRMVGTYARRRHGEIKQTNEGLQVRHTELLSSGRELLEKLKATPADPLLRSEIERVQNAMAAIQRDLRRGANTLQRDLAPSLAMIDRICDSVRRLAGADDTVGLKRTLKAALEHVQELYASQPGMPARDLIEADAWEKAVVSEIEQAAGFHDAYARAGYHVTLALAMVTMAVSDEPPRTSEEATQRANESVAIRLKEITARFANP